MELKLTLDARQQRGLDEKLAWYNAANPLAPLTPEEFIISQWVTGPLNGLADQSDVATTSDRKKLEDAIIADPVAVKAAIEARRAKEAQVVADVVAVEVVDP